MSALPDENQQDENARLEAATDHAIAACDSDQRSAIRALLLANEYLQWELETKVSKGYGRGVRRGHSDG